MLSGVVIEAGLVAMLRALGTLVAVSWTWYLLLIGIGALNMLVGNLMAFATETGQAASSIFQCCPNRLYALGLGIAFYSGQPDGAQGSLFHLLNHGMMKGPGISVGRSDYCMLCILRAGSWTLIDRRFVRRCGGVTLLRL